MTKVHIEEADLNVDICLNGCGGILFNNRELEKFDDKSKNADEIFEALRGKTFVPVNENEVRICPVCNTPMVKQGSGVEGVEIDVCNVCGAKFLDNGELEKIRECEKHSEYQAKINHQVDKGCESEGKKGGNLCRNSWRRYSQGKT